MKYLLSVEVNIPDTNAGELVHHHFISEIKNLLDYLSSPGDPESNLKNIRLTVFKAQIEL